MADCGLEPATLRPSQPRAVSSPAVVGRFGICVKSAAERPLRELRGPILRPFLGPRSSRFERLTRFRIFRMADCRLGRVAALQSI
eukprot:9688607-Alexandrium_andersonii.AAC.1